MRKSFLLLIATFALFIMAASAPSPLYAIFQQQWSFSAMTLTVIFAVYAFALLLALLFFGSLSDYIGRRPVLFGALVIEAASMALFASARGVSWLIAARLLQGVATGIATAVLGAALIDTEPKNKPGLAALLSTIVPVASLGAGALAAGLLVQYAAWPTHLVFWILSGFSVVLGLAVLRMPESATRQSGWRHSLVPTVSVPRVARKVFLAGSTSLVASWSLVGLYLSLGPSVANSLLHSQNHVAGGLIILALTASGAAASAVLHSQRNAKLITAGAIVASVGVFASMGGIMAPSPALFFAGTVVAGLGFGPALSGAYRNIMSRAPHAQRASLAAAVFVVSYLALGVPVILAGIMASRFGLHTAVLVYGAGVVALYILTFALPKS